MHIFNTRTGFTLIELLVVVLIIGILSAIAVASYKAHITRASLTQQMITNKAITDAQFRYYQTKSAYAAKISDIDIALSASYSYCSTYPHYNGGEIYINGKHQALITNSAWGAGSITGTCPNYKDKDTIIFTVIPGVTIYGATLGCPASNNMPCTYCIGTTSNGKKACAGVGKYIAPYSPTADAYSIGG